MSHFKIGALALWLSAAATVPSGAAVVGLNPNVDLSTGPYSFSIAGGVASYIFSNSGMSGFFGLLPAVQTGGTATVASDGAPFFPEPRPGTYFTDEGRRPTFDATTLTRYVSYGTPAVVNAQTDSYIGLKFTLGDGDHFGFARLAGLFLSEIAYETVAGQSILAGPGPYGPLPAAVPLPAAFPLLGVGLAALMGLRLRRRRAAVGV